MVFDGVKIIVLLVVLLQSCSKSIDVQHQGYFQNMAHDTIYCFWGDEISPYTPSTLQILPMAKIMFTAGESYNTLDDLKLFYNEVGKDSIVFYNNFDTIVWYAPFVKLSDSVHSFYNENSWEIKKGGHKNKYTISTFRIYESDFKNKK